jgi:hypothetical protein
LVNVLATSATHKSHADASKTSVPTYLHMQADLEDSREQIPPEEDAVISAEQSQLAKPIGGGAHDYPPLAHVLGVSQAYSGMLPRNYKSSDDNIVPLNEAGYGGGDAYVSLVCDALACNEVKISSASVPGARTDKAYFMEVQASAARERAFKLLVNSRMHIVAGHLGVISTDVAHAPFNNIGSGLDLHHDDVSVRAHLSKSDVQVLSTGRIPFCQYEIEMAALAKNPERVETLASNLIYESDVSKLKKAYLDIVQVAVGADSRLFKGDNSTNSTIFGPDPDAQLRAMLDNLKTVNTVIVEEAHSTYFSRARLAGRLFHLAVAARHMRLMPSSELLDFPPVNLHAKSSSSGRAAVLDDSMDQRALFLINPYLKNSDLCNPQVMSTFVRSVDAQWNSKEPTNDTLYAQLKSGWQRYSTISTNALIDQANMVQCCERTSDLPKTHATSQINHSMWHTPSGPDGLTLEITRSMLIPSADSYNQGVNVHDNFDDDAETKLKSERASVCNGMMCCFRVSKSLLCKMCTLHVYSIDARMWLDNPSKIREQVRMLCCDSKSCPDVLMIQNTYVPSVRYMDRSCDSFEDVTVRVYDNGHQVDATLRYLMHDIFKELGSYSYERVSYQQTRLSNETNELTKLETIRAKRALDRKVPIGNAVYLRKGSEWYTKDRLAEIQEQNRRMESNESSTCAEDNIVYRCGRTSYYDSWF